MIRDVCRGVRMTLHIKTCLPCSAVAGFYYTLVRVRASWMYLGKGSNYMRTGYLGMVFAQLYQLS